MPDQRPQTAYIDINHQYALSRADAGAPDRPEHAAALAKLQAEVDHGRLVSLLSAVAHGSDRELPGSAARACCFGHAQALGLLTIAPRRTIVDKELAREMNRRFGRPAFPIKVPKNGYGVGFAFGAPGRVKATSFTDEERARIEAQVGKTIADLELEANAFFEYWLLATPWSLRDAIPGFEPVSTRQDALTELAEIQVMVDSLRNKDKEIAKRPKDGIAARQLCREALSVAIPYADAVVIDADVWGVATSQTHLNTEFNTPIFKSLTQLIEHLGL